MRQPKVGDVIYAYAWSNDQVGETQFITETQENAIDSLEKLKGIIEYKLRKMDGLTREEFGKPMIFAMTRIK